MTLDEVKEKIPKEIHQFARFSVDLEHNGNFFSLTPLFGLAAFVEWWEKNEEAYTIDFVDTSRTKYDVSICISSVDE